MIGVAPAAAELPAGLRSEGVSGRVAPAVAGPVAAGVAPPVAAGVAELSSRDRAVLAATAAGRVELLAGCCPALLVDGRWCCDQAAAAALVRAGLVAAASPAPAGVRVPAVLTAAGRSAAGVPTADVVELGAPVVQLDDAEGGECRASA